MRTIRMHFFTNVSGKDFSPIFELAMIIFPILDCKCLTPVEGFILSQPQPLRKLSVYASSVAQTIATAVLVSQTFNVCKIVWQI